MEDLRQLLADYLALASLWEWAEVLGGVKLLVETPRWIVILIKVIVKIGCMGICEMIAAEQENAEQWALFKRTQVLELL